MNTPPPLALCFGEVLWDFLPNGLYLGGASLNGAYHLHRQGLDVLLISAVGRDVLGDELLRRLGQWGLPISGLARLDHTPTGYVRVAVGANGDARFDIVTEVAWDRIAASPATLEAAARAGAFIFGSLAQRSPFNRNTFERILAALPPAALRVFDVNLRPPYDDLVLVRELARKATVLKLNADEAARLAGREAEAGREEACARSLAAQTGCSFIVITAGARGAGLLRNNRWLWEPGRPVKVVDTVGAGDAFVASLVMHLLQARLPDQEILSRACRLGEWVASHPGGTPAYDSSTPR